MASVANESAAAGEPIYIQGRQRSEFVAHFHPGTTVQVELGRRRRYPGLQGPAPPTHLCYRKFLELGLNASRVVDAGCGAGIGLRLLCQSKSRLIGVDNDGKAVAFARRYVPDVELIHADVQSLRLNGVGGAAVVVDVLGLVSDPARFLRSLARRVDGLEALFVAEPIASREQVLEAPARRAFGLSSLRSLFTRCGFELSDWTTVGDGFICAIGRPMRDPLGELLGQAEDAYLSHQSQKLEAICRQLNHSGRAELRLEAALLESRLRFDVNQYDHAIALLSDASALVPEDPRPWAGLSRLALASGNAVQAIRLAENALKLDATDFSSVCSSALAYAEPDPHRSLVAWKTANALAPDEATIARFLCAVALAEGRHEEGLQLLERAGQYQTDTSPLNEHVGLLALTGATLQGRNTF